MQILETFMRGVGPEDGCAAATNVAVPKGRFLFRVTGSDIGFVVSHSDLGEVANLPVSGTVDHVLEVPQGILRVSVNTVQETASSATVSMFPL